uniref:NADH-ubiquinone oxidoreductase chain 5 n=1 Tax=Pennahia pawak TaxID=1334976 RepID=A0A343J7H5_9TELE|nr:NADH dehydrogenase subunit 5 [Pennahia pawak]ASW20607.1 NADH dehydrogenase subunit 5 [Pennahia pawak]
MPVTTTYIMLLALLIYPILTSLLPKHDSAPPATSLITTNVMLAFFLSLNSLFLFIAFGSEEIVASWTWISIQSHSATLSFKFDHYSLIFTSVALFITWSILEYSSWYMHQDHNLSRFFKYLLTFLITMILVVTANSLLQLFVGWEGVGIMSFLLIGWWFSRTDANTAALQAILYNRIGDIGLLLTIVWMATSFNSWELPQVFAEAKTKDLTIPLIGLVIAASSKSAQFGLHPWLPAAMEGPTPVSALLHSSTMVVAGVFLLIRLNPLMEDYPQVLSFCLGLGALSTFFAAACALTQHDIKKIVAFSTASQLGLMMVAIGLNQPQLAFLHICTHAFFKAMLFLCAGTIIHSLNDEQDIRKMGGIHTILPFTSTCFIIGNLALMGMPYLSAFFSKDAIIEALNSHSNNSWALALTLLATTFSAVYTIRLIFLVSLSHPRFNSFLPINENNPAVTNPVKRLAWGSIIAGFLITSTMIPYKTQVMTMPQYIKLTALIITVLGIILALEILHYSNMKSPKISSPKSLRFFLLLGFFPLIIHRRLPKLNLRLGLLASYLIDQTWLEKVTPKAMVVLNKVMVILTGNAQQGKIKTFLTIFLITLIFTTILINS